MIALNICVTFTLASLPVVEIKYPEKCNLREKGLTPTHDSEAQSNLKVVGA